MEAIGSISIKEKNVQHWLKDIYMYRWGLLHNFHDQSGMVGGIKKK